MKHFYDLEFLENGRTIELISIGIVSDDGAEYYAVNSDIQTDENLHARISMHDFLAKEVVRHLPLTNETDVAEQLEKAAMSQGHPYFGPSVPDNPHWHQQLHWTLDLTRPEVKPKWVIANEVRQYFLNRLDHGMTFPEEYDGDPVGEIELWANYGAYDHIGVMQLWGPMIARPPFLPMFTHDLQHFAHDLGVGEEVFPEQPEENRHDALADARHDQLIWITLDRLRHEKQRATAKAMEER